MNKKKVDKIMNQPGFKKGWEVGFKMACWVFEQMVKDRNSDLLESVNTLKLVVSAAQLKKKICKKGKA